MVSLFELAVVCFAGICVGFVIAVVAATCVMSKGFDELKKKTDERWEKSQRDHAEILTAVKDPKSRV